MNPFSVLNQAMASREHWLVMYFLKYVYWIILNPQKSYGLQL